MASCEIGARAGAILSANDTTVKLLGYGVYDGPQMGGPVPFPNPRITLDNGDVVWGCQCWWGPEEKIKAMIGSREVVLVNIDGTEKQVH